VLLDLAFGRDAMSWAAGAPPGAGDLNLELMLLAFGRDVMSWAALNLELV